jgi:hypothetical protein
VSGTTSAGARTAILLSDAGSSESPLRPPKRKGETSQISGDAPDEPSLPAELAHREFNPPSDDASGGTPIDSQRVDPEARWAAAAKSIKSTAPTVLLAHRVVQLRTPRTD